MQKVEILIVALVVGLMAALSGVAVTTARARTRDVTRLAHVREVQLGLEMYFQSHSAYPESSEAVPLGQALTACLGVSGFDAPCDESGPTPYLETVPTPPEQGLDELVSCGGVENVYCYTADSESYRVQFELEKSNVVLGLEKGLNCATEEGLKPGACTDVATAE